MEKPLSEEIVDSILDGNKESFMAAFQAAIAAKVTDALEVKKVEIASTLITPEVAVEEEIDLDESKGEMDDEDKDKDKDKDEDEDSEDMKEEVEQIDELKVRGTLSTRAAVIGRMGVAAASVGGNLMRAKLSNNPKTRDDALNKTLDAMQRVPKLYNAYGRMIREINPKRSEGYKRAARTLGAEVSDAQNAMDRRNRRMAEEETVNNKMATINEDLGSAYEEIMASHHSAIQKGRDALAKGDHDSAQKHFVNAGLHLSKAEEVAKDYFKFHGVELHKPDHPRYSPYITGNWDKVN
jgi:hypothetical protein